MVTDRQIMTQLIAANAGVLNAELEFQAAVATSLLEAGGSDALRDSVQAAMETLQGTLQQRHDAVAALQATISGG